MKNAALLLALALPLFPQDGFRPLFNGRNLDEFIVDTPGLWQVRDGAITGKSAGLKYNDFLRTKKLYSNFILKAEFRLTGGIGNSGIQFRSKPVENSHEVFGYQADVGAQYWGSLYDESRRKKVLTGPPKEFVEKLNKDAWHSYVVTANGNRITLELDGVKTVDWTEAEPGIEQTGFIAFQVHSGPPTEVQFRKIEIKELP